VTPMIWTISISMGKRLYRHLYRQRNNRRNQLHVQRLNQQSQDSILKLFIDTFCVAEKPRVL
jgi:hypothetical protein